MHVYISILGQPSHSTMIIHDQIGNSRTQKRLGKVMNWMEKLSYIFIFILSAILSGSAYYAILSHVNLEPTTKFILSWALMIIVGGLGLFTENNLLWGNKFERTRTRQTLITRRTAPAPPPLTTGIILGIMSFLYW